MFNKIRKLFSNPKLKKAVMISSCMALMACVMIPFASAADATSEPTPAEAATQIFSAIHAELNFTTILSVLAVAVGAALSIFLGWWAIRKVTRMVMSAFSKGKISI